MERGTHNLSRVLSSLRQHSVHCPSSKANVLKKGSCDCWRLVIQCWRLCSVLSRFNLWFLMNITKWWCFWGCRRSSGSDLCFIPAKPPSQVITQWVWNKNLNALNICLPELALNDIWATTLLNTKFGWGRISLSWNETALGACLDLVIHVFYGIVWMQTAQEISSSCSGATTFLKTKIASS